MGKSNNSCLTVTYNKGVLHAIVISNAERGEDIEKIISSIFNHQIFQKEIFRYYCVLKPSQIAKINVITLENTLRENLIDLIDDVEVVEENENGPFSLDRSAVIENIFISLSEEEAAYTKIAQDYRAAIGELQQPPSDDSDRASLQEERSTIQRNENLAQRNIEAIQAAIERYHRGEFGICKNPACGEEIDIYRLIAHPAAALCIECMAKAERA